MRTMITQQDDMGCGVACLAFATDITYEVAVDILGSDKARSVGFRCKELTDGLKVLGYTYIHKHINAVRNKKLLKQDGTIVFIKRSTRYPYGHYLVRSGNQWGDPWINLVVDGDISSAKSGYRRRFPDSVQWVLLPECYNTNKKIRVSPLAREQESSFIS